jgi:protein-S-isoprenylcysteine O-methyltransferase Ste14
MRYLLIFLFLACVFCFGWARRNYFMRTSETPTLRRGLRPMGTILAMVNLAAIGWQGSDRLGVQSLTVIACFISSLLLFFAALRSHGEYRPAIAFTPGAPQVLNMRGPYRSVRHPIYTAYLLFWGGGLIAAPMAATFASFGLMFWFYYRAAGEEENAIAHSPLAQAYSTYSRTAGMFFPRFAGRGNR